MSRTYKDKPTKVRFPESRHEMVEYTYVREDYYTGVPHEGVGHWYRKGPAGPKLKRVQDNDYHWLQSTPSWWVNLYMNRPQRARARAWERKTLKVALAELDAVDKPSVNKKPHLYYW